MQQRFKSLSYFIGLLSASYIYAGEMGPIKTGFDKNRLYLGGEAIYGYLYNGTETYAKTYNKDVNGNYYYTGAPKSQNSDGWGFRVITGYHLDSSNPHDLEASYLYLNKNGSSQTRADRIVSDWNSSDTFTGTSLNQASVTQSIYAQYQKLEINNKTQQVWTWFPAVQQDYIYGLRGIYFKNGATTYFSNGSLQKQSRIIEGNEVYAIGPQIGTALKWNLLEHFDIGGDFLTGLLFGNYQARFSQNLSNTAASPQQLSYTDTYSQGTAYWLLSGQIYVGFKYFEKNNQVFRVDAGLSGDANYGFSNQNNFHDVYGVSANTISNYSNTFIQFRDIFIRLVYKA